MMKKLYPEYVFIGLVVKKDRKVFNHLYDNYSASLYAIVLKIIRNEGVSQDLLPDIYLKIRENAESYDAGKGRIFIWMLHVARNTCIDYYVGITLKILDLSTVCDTNENNQNIFSDIGRHPGIALRFSPDHPGHMIFFMCCCAAYFLPFIE